MANPTGFIDTADVEELQNLLEAYENSMDVGVLDGFLTAAALNPNRPSNEDVIPYVFDEEGDPEAVPDDAACSNSSTCAVAKSKPRSLRATVSTPSFSPQKTKTT